MTENNIDKINLTLRHLIISIAPSDNAQEENRLIREAKAAIQKLIDEAVLEGRKEQVMQDFMDLEDLDDILSHFFLMRGSIDIPDVFWSANKHDSIDEVFKQAIQALIDREIQKVRDEYTKK